MDSISDEMDLPDEREYVYQGKNKDSTSIYGLELDDGSGILKDTGYALSSPHQRQNGVNFSNDEILVFDSLNSRNDRPRMVGKSKENSCKL